MGGNNMSAEQQYIGRPPMVFSLIGPWAPLHTLMVRHRTAAPSHSEGSPQHRATPIDMKHRTKTRRAPPQRTPPD